MRFIFMVTAVCATAAAIGCARERATPVAAPAQSKVSAVGACLAAMCPFTMADLARPRPAGHAERQAQDLALVIQPLINERIDQATTSHAYRDLIDLFPTVSFADVILDDNVRVLLNLFHALDALGLVEANGLLDQNPKNGSRSFDHARAIKLWRQRPEFAEAGEPLATAVESLVNSTGYRLMDLRDHVSISWFYHQVPRKMTYRRFLRELFDGLKRAEAMVNQVFPYLERPKSELMRRYEAKQVISDQDSSALLGELASYELMADALTEASQRAALLAVPRDYVAEANRVRNGIRERNQSDRAWPRAAVEAHCLARYREKLATLPTAGEIEAFDQNERVPTQAIAVAALRELGLTEGANRLLTAAVHYPAPYGRAVRQLADELRADIDSRRAQITRLNRLRDHVRLKDPAARADLLALFVGQGIDDPREINSVYGACDGVRPTPMRDATFDTEIAVSWQILLHQLSARTLAHEMGHAAYYAYPDDQRPEVMANQVACLKRRHRGLEPNPERYVVEDYADLVGNEVTSRLGDRRTSSLCEYVGDNEIVAQDPTNVDAHSTTLFRLLTLAGGDVPPRCEAVVRQSGASNLSERCWRPAPSAR